MLDSEKMKKKTGDYIHTHPNPKPTEITNQQIEKIGNQQIETWTWNPYKNIHKPNCKNIKIEPT